MAGKQKKPAKILGRAAALLMAAALVLTSSTTAFAAGDLDSLKQKQAEYAQQKKDNDGKLAQLRQDKSKKEDYKAALEAQISTLQNQIDTYNAQIANLDDNILQTQKAITGKQTDITANTEKLKQRLCALYMSGGASNLEILLSAKSVVDLADKAEALQMVTQHDTSLIETLRKDMDSVKKQKETIEANREEASTAKTSVSSKQGELSGLVSEAQSVINDMTSKESDMQSASDDLAQKEESAGAAVDKWYADYEASQQEKKVEAAQQQAAQQQKPSSEKNGGSSSRNASAVGSGSLMWPVPSCQTITSPFGYRESPGGIGSKYHRGIDIGASYGSAIVAADSGTVIMAGSGAGYEGYGNVVVIDHGNGISTLAAHMSSVAVSNGQTVAKGQIIGYVGSTGNSTGPHCHFEVRVNGSAVDPMGYV